MPTKEPRINITFTNQSLYEAVVRDAEYNHRSISGQIMFVLEKDIEVRKREADLFTTPQLHEAKQQHVPHFETPDRPQVEPVLKPRESGRQGKS